MDNFKLFITILLLPLLNYCNCQSSSSSSNSLILNNFYITWTPRETQTDYIIIANFDNITTTNFWFAIGFNYDKPTMNGSNLVVCKNLENEESLIQHYINMGDVSSLLDPENPYVGLSNLNKIEQYENNLTCTFTRDNNNTNINNYFVYEPGTKYYMVAAYGQILTDPLIKNLTIMQNHEKFYASDLLVISDTIVSDIDFNLTNMSAQIRQGQSNNRNTTLVVQNPFFTLYSTENQNTIDFVFSTVVLADNNVWAGFAFSKDNQMGDDNVCLCKYSNNLQTVEHYYSSSKSTPTLLDPNNPSVGISNSIVTLVNGVLTCSFTRLKSYPACQNFFDLNNPYYILNAAGPTDNSGNIQKHLNRIVSNDRIKLTCDIPTTTPQPMPKTTKCAKCNPQPIKLPDLTVVYDLFKKLLNNLMFKIKDICLN